MADDRVSVLAAEDRRRAALVAVDIEALEALFDDDLVHVHSTGMVHDKPGLLEYIASRRAFIAIERGPLDVRLYGDVAIVTGPMTNRMQGPDGEITMSGFVTQVLRRVADHWRFVSFQLTLGDN